MPEQVVFWVVAPISLGSGNTVDSIAISTNTPR